MPIRRRRNPKGDILLKQSLQITDTQIRILDNGDFGIFQVVPAPGVGKVLVFVQAIVTTDVTAGIYTNIGNASALKIAYDCDPATGNLLDIAKYTDITGIIGNGTKNITFLPFITELTVPFQFGPRVDYENKNLGFYLINGGNLTGNFTGGNVANNMKVTICYDIVTL